MGRPADMIFRHAVPRSEKARNEIVLLSVLGGIGLGRASHRHDQTNQSSLPHVIIMGRQQPVRIDGHIFQVHIVRQTQQEIPRAGCNHDVENVVAAKDRGTFRQQGFEVGACGLVQFLWDMLRKVQRDCAVVFLRSLEDAGFSVKFNGLMGVACYRKMQEGKTTLQVHALSNKFDRRFDRHHDTKILIFYKSF